MEGGPQRAIEDDDLALGADAGDEGSASADTDIRALLTAVVLHRRLFAEAHDGALSSSTLLSPPPTPTAKTTIKRGQMLQALRTVLGSRVFEDEGIIGARAARDVDADDDAVEELGLEDARDRVVDMIFDSERKVARSVAFIILCTLRLPLPNTSLRLFM